MGHHGAQVSLILGPNLAPVLRLGVIGAQLDDHHVGAEFSRLFEGTQFPVGPVTVFQHRGAVHPIIADRIPFAQQIGQYLGITVVGPVPNRGPIGNAIAHTGNSSHRIRPAGQGADHKENAKNGVFHGKNRAEIKTRLSRACKLFGGLMKHSHGV